MKRILQIEIDASEDENDCGNCGLLWYRANGRFCVLWAETLAKDFDKKANRCSECLQAEQPIKPTQKWSTTQQVSFEATDFFLEAKPALYGGELWRTRCCFCGWASKEIYPKSLGSKKSALCEAIDHAEKGCKSDI